RGRHTGREVGRGREGRGRAESGHAGQRRGSDGAVQDEARQREGAEVGRFRRQAAAQPGGQGAEARAAREVLARQDAAGQLRGEKVSVKELFDLSGKVALITGGSRGLGLQMAEALGEMGARVVITARKADELQEARAHLKEHGIEALTVANDLSNFDAIPGLVDQVVAACGTIDILVNNAGVTWGAPAEDHPPEAWN